MGVVFVNRSPRTLLSSPALTSLADFTFRTRRWRVACYLLLAVERLIVETRQQSEPCFREVTVRLVLQVHPTSNGCGGQASSDKVEDYLGIYLLVTAVSTDLLGQEVVRLAFRLKIRVRVRNRCWSRGRLECSMQLGVGKGFGAW